LERDYGTGDTVGERRERERDEKKKIDDRITDDSVHSK
jgi:hypothetical protein